MLLGMPVSLQTAFMVSADNMEGEPWVITDFILLEGHPYWLVKPRSTALSRFVTSTAHGLRNMRSPWFNEIRIMRNQERVKRLLHGASAPLFVAASSKAKARRELQQAKGMQEPSASYPLALPSVEFNGVVVGPIVMNVKNTSDFNEHVSIELCEANLEYLRVAVLARAKEYEEELARKKEIPEGIKNICFWRDDRGAYICKRKREDGAMQYKTVRPKTLEDDDMSPSARPKKKWVKKK